MPKTRRRFAPSRPIACTLAAKDYNLPLREIEAPVGRFRWRYLIAVLITLLLGARIAASYVIDYEWWREMGQVDTWLKLLTYGVAPTVAATAIAFLVFWLAHMRAMLFARVAGRSRRIYSVLMTLLLLGIALLISAATLDSWDTVRFFAGRNLDSTAAWLDPMFGKPLAFYLFELPFYSMLLRFIIATAIIAALVYWLTARGWQLRNSHPDLSKGLQFQFSDLHLSGALESFFLRGAASIFMAALAVHFYLERYALLLNDHGFMVGADYIDQNITLPLLWCVIASCLIGALGAWLGRFSFLLLFVLALILRAAVPPAVGAAYVRPNEIALERPFIARHIQATRSAFALDTRIKEVEFQAKPDARIDLDLHKPLLDNVRLWDWKAFHDTVSQNNPLRPYIYSETDVDRYTIDGQLRQVLLTPRELDLNGLGDAKSRWINPHFIYTHGYGILMAEANRITPNGLPVLFVKDAPPTITVPGLAFTRPEIYYGEVVHEPVFVRTAQPEFNYPSGADNVSNRYDGTGGFPISSVVTRTAAAIAGSDWNILLTSNLTPESRMMIHRKVTDRLHELAGFVLWDTDPYLVLTKPGRLVWIVDGYLTSDAHPYSSSVAVEGAGEVNYIRNSIKATVDAYDGTVNLYSFDTEDPLLRAYSSLFPHLFRSATDMPADLRAHTRYPQVIFNVQAEVYRTFHMREAETFYNKSDAWDLARFTSGQASHPEPLAPTYVVATLPGETKPEFLLITPFTPRNRDNLIGLMMARCDGEHLGEKVVLLLSKQEIILGPMLVEARINQDQNISKDLTLWNQQGSQVLRGQMLVLPIGNTFLYVEPIYIQAVEAKMPQLKKVALAMGNTLVYADTYQQALSMLTGSMPETAAPAKATTPGAPASGQDARLEEIRRHLARYRDLTSQGKWSEAGKELEAVQSIVGR